MFCQINQFHTAGVRIKWSVDAGRANLFFLPSCVNPGRAGHAYPLDQRAVCHTLSHAPLCLVGGHEARLASLARQTALDDQKMLAVDGWTSYPAHHFTAFKDSDRVFLTRTSRTFSQMNVLFGSSSSVATYGQI
jgi:hypothetical protein